MKLWLDDVREPWKFGALGYKWAKTYSEAVAWLQTGQVTFASLDHDLAWEHYPGAGVARDQYQEPDGEEVLKWITQNNAWPVDGIRIHSMNPDGAKRMRDTVRDHYGRNFPDLG